MFSFKTSAGHDFNRASFERQVEASLDAARRVLGEARLPTLPADVDHAYADKFSLAEAAVQTSLCCAAQTLLALPLGGEGASTKLSAVHAWAAAGEEVTLRFALVRSCTFVQEQVVQDTSPGRQHTVHQTETVGGAVVKSVETSVSSTVREWVWSCKAEWALEAFAGVGTSPAAVGKLSGRAVEVCVTTRANAAPFPELLVVPPLEVPLTWLLKHLASPATPGDAVTSPLFTASFGIDRLHEDCHTPRRNPDVESALKALDGLRGFSRAVRDQLAQHWFALGDAADPARRVDWGQLNAESLLMPFALFTPPPAEGEAPPPPLPAAAPPLALAPGGAEGTSPLLDRGALNVLLAESARVLEERCASFAAQLPAPSELGAVASGCEARLLIALDWARRSAEAMSGSVDYVEDMLRAQIVAAVGKHLQPSDFESYMRFHCRKMFAPEFQPRPLCFAVRRSAEHAPEGLLQIVSDDGSGEQPIHTVSCAMGPEEQPLMSFPLSAEAEVKFGGDRHLHAWLAHAFSSAQPPQLTLLASARQFSSFILLVGRLSGARSFEPAAAIIVRDKDELRIPLRVAALPTPKEFKDAVASLSPEQAEFARAFRAMQLENSVFALLALQIKPQLELLLGLEPESLVKEVQLTSELMDLFIKFQIPSDLLSFGGPAAADGATRLAAVKAHVAAIREMIGKSEERAIEQRKREEHYANPVPQAGMFGAAAPATFGFGGPAPAFGSAFGAAPASRALMSRAAPMMAMAMNDSAPPPPPPRAMEGGAPPGAKATGDGAAPQPPKPKTAEEKAEEAAEAEGGGGRDLTRVPALLESAYERLDADNAMRPTTITADGPWTRRSYASLLSREPVSSTLYDGDQSSCKSAAFDLLDALSRSGALPMRAAALHVVLGATHCFDSSLMDTLVRKSINPIARVERSQLIIASVVHAATPGQLVRREQRARLEAHSPTLFDVPSE